MCEQAAYMCNINPRAAAAAAAAVSLRVAIYLNYLLWNFNNSATIVQMRRRFVCLFWGENECQTHTHIHTDGYAHDARAGSVNPNTFFLLLRFGTGKTQPRGWVGMANVSYFVAPANATGTCHLAPRMQQHVALPFRSRCCERACLCVQGVCNVSLNLSTTRGFRNTQTAYTQTPSGGWKTHS